jgi:hypothetical protein
MGRLSWSSCDGRQSAGVSYMFGPEQTDNNGRVRSLVTASYTKTFGSCDQWYLILAGIGGWDPLVADGADAQWYGGYGALFYTINPKVRLGTRGEWFADPQGARTGFATNYTAATLGITYWPFQNVRIRPEFRMDFADHGVTPYNDQTDTMQYTCGFDCIWDF